MPASLPPCFAEVWRRRQSTQPFDRRQRATLEAVASTLPPEAAASTGDAAAAVYLAALVVSLQRLVATTKMAKPVNDFGVEKPLSKKERKKLRRQARQKEDAVKDMPAADVLSSLGSAPPVKMDEDKNQGEGESQDSDVDLVASLVSLIGMAIRGTSQAVLNAKCDVVLEALMNAYDYAYGNSTVSRHLSPAFASVLSVMDAVCWSKPLVQRSYLYLLRQTADADSRSRRRARDSLAALLMSPRASIVQAKTSGTAAAHFGSELKLQTTALHDAIHGDTVLEQPMSSASLIYLLTTVERFGPFLLPEDAAKVSKELLLIAAKELANVTPFAYMALSAMLSQRREESSAKTGKSEKTTLLSHADLGKLFKALFDHEPHSDCAQDIRMSFNSCVTDAAIAYATCFDYASPPRDFIVTPVRIICDCISPVNGQNDLTKNAASNLRNLFEQRWFKSRPEVLKLLLNFVSTGSRMNWPELIPVLKDYLEKNATAASANMQTEMKRLSKTLVRMRDEALGSNDRKVQDMVNGVLCAIARGGGVQQILDSCAIQYDEKLHITNAWALPILRDNIRGAPITLFSKTFIPLIDRMKEKMTITEKEGRVVETKNLGIYVSQVWALFPGFCSSPSDLGHDGVMTLAFKSIHICLSTSNREPIHNIGVSALRQLATSLRKLDDTDPMTVGKRESFGHRFKKLFPVILSAAEATLQDKRRNLLEAVTVSCQATNNPTLVSGLLRKSIRRLLELQIDTSKNADLMADDEDNNVRGHHAMADVAIAVIESDQVPHDAAEVIYLEKAMSPFLLDMKQSSLQKKAYRAMALLVGTASASSASEEVLSVAKKVAEAGPKVAPGAKALRQNLLVVLINQHLRLSNDEKTQYLDSLTELFLSEIVLATRDTSEKTRSAAFETLITLARGWNTAGTATDMTGLRTFLVAVSAGLGGRTVSMLSATLTSLGRLIYEFRGEASANEKLASDVDALFASSVGLDSNETMRDDSEDQGEVNQVEKIQPGPVAILLRHNAYEVQKAALGIVKIATKTLSVPIDRLTLVLPAILPGLVHVAARSKKQETRLKVRVILERLLRKCGREALEENFPQDHIRLLSAVRKKFSRDLIKKHAAKDRKRKALDARSKDMESGDGHEDVDENDFGIEDSDSDIEKELIDGDELRTSRKKRGARDSSKSLRVREQGDDVLNLLDERSSHSVVMGNDFKETAQQARLEHNRKRSSKSDDGIEYTRDGKPIFVESDDDSGEVGVGSVDGSENSGSDDEGNSGQTLSLSKRKRNLSDHESKNEKRQRVAFGHEYKAKNASGDVKKTGRPDPYAYIPLGVNVVDANPRSRSTGRRRSHHNSSLQRLRTRTKLVGNGSRASSKR